MSEQPDARPAAFLASWDLIKRANQALEESNRVIHHPDWETK